MKLKHKPNDFRVRELLKDDYLTEHGPHHVYHITKRKLTSLEAAEILAELAQVPVAEVAMAGLKDRQGVTEQFMSTHGGRKAELNTPELKIAPVGTAQEALTAENSYGNAFDLRLRELTPIEMKRLMLHKHVVGRLGVPNYFDEQRFGNLRHGQGWVAKDLMLGQHEKALRNLLCAESEFDAGKMGAFKAALREHWGDWSECREVAGRFGEHHSVFDFLRREPENFAGAFFHISSRMRLIHLYAFQSHIWNRAVAGYFAELSGDQGARVGYTIEGPQVFPDRKLDVDEAWDGSFRLPGVGLEDVVHEVQRKWLTSALKDEGLTPEQFRIEGISGFQLKGEDRRLFIRPRHLKIDSGSPGEGSDGSVRLAFELPRGAYATLVVRGLLSRFFKGSIDLPRLGTYDPQYDEPDRQAAGRGGDRSDDRGHRGGAGQRVNYRASRHGDRERPSPWGGGARREDSRGGSFGNRGGYDQRGERSYGGRGRDDSRSAYPGRGEGEQRGGYSGGRGDERGGQSHSGGRSHFGGQGRYGNSGGGERGRDDSRGSFQDRGGNAQRGGYQARGSGEQRGGSTYGGGRSHFGGPGRYGNSGDGERGREDSRGSFQSRGGSEQRGGYSGRSSNEQRGGSSFGGGRSSGGGASRYNRSAGDEGREDSGGSFQRRDSREQRGGYSSRGGNGQRGGYQDRGSSEQRGGQSYGSGASRHGNSGGDRGRDDSRGSFQSRGGAEQRSSYRGRDSSEQRGGYPSRDSSEQRGGSSFGGGHSKFAGRSPSGGPGRYGNFGGGGGRDDSRGSYSSRGSSEQRGGSPRRGGNDQRGGSADRGESKGRRWEGANVPPPQMQRRDEKPAKRSRDEFRGRRSDNDRRP